MFSSGTRTVKTFFSDGTGPPRMETKTYTFGGDGGGPSVGFGGGEFNVGFGDTFGDRGMKFMYGGDGGGSHGGGATSYGGGGSSHGGAGGGGFSLPGGIRFGGFTRGGPRQCSRDPEIGGRATRKAKKNPFAGVEDQKYADIKSKCLQEGILFEDPEFPAVDNSIFFSRAPPRPFEWKRPREICDDPQFVSEGASRFDVQQGELGDCWLLAAVASLTCNKKLLARVVPPEQNFTDDYCGMYKFNIWHQGDWVEVVVDDRLPTYCNQLVFMHSTDRNEFWSALLEKAYAKLCGSYESLKGGSTSEAMEDFTGGVTEMFDLQKSPPNLLRIMLKAYDRCALMGCSIDPSGMALEAELDNGLVVGHAYSVTAVKLMNIVLPRRRGRIDVQTARVQGQIPMVRIRNPWGNEAEWKGAWSDQSQEWTLISEDEKQEMGLTFDDDGEFWMSFQDFKDNFSKLEICNLGPDSLDEADLSNKKKWEVNIQHADWKRRVNAGGCRNYIDTFWTNPQFRVTLTDPDDDDDDDMCTMIAALLQKDRRKKRKEGLDLLTIGYVIYKIEDPDSGPLDINFFKYNASVAKSPTFINMREVCGRHKLPPGTYCIIPSTFEPNEEGHFLMRIFTEKANVAGEIDERTSYEEGRHRRQPVQVPRTVKTARDDGIQHHLHGDDDDEEAPPPTEQEQEQEDSLKTSFRRIAGEDMEIDAYELMEILNTVFTKEFEFAGFTVDTTRSMVAMHDGDLSGKLGYDEFKSLWTDLRRWKGVFKEYDRDQSGKLCSYELRAALHSVGFKLSNMTFRSVVMRYSNQEGQIEFGDFIMCAIRLKTMLSSFKSSDPEGRGMALYDVDTFIQTTMYS